MRAMRVFNGGFSLGTDFEIFVSFCSPGVPSHTGSADHEVKLCICWNPEDQVITSAGGRKSSE